MDGQKGYLNFIDMINGGGMGAVGIMDGGTFKMNKSGGSKRVLTALAKML